MTRFPDWLDRVLAADDLGPDEREALEGWLAERPDARGLLERLRSIERGEAGPAGSAPPLETLDAAFARLSTADRAAAEASLASLRARVASEQPGRAPAGTDAPRGDRPGWIARIRARLFPAGAGPGWRLAPVALAAAVIAVVVLVRPYAPRESRLGTPRIESAARWRGGETDTARVWRTGDTFVLRCPVEAAIRPLLFHVDPEGAVSLLHPPATDAPWPVHPGDRPLELPPPGSGEEWILEGTSGPETFLLAAASADDARRPDLDSLVAQARLVGTQAADREDTVRRLVALLEAAVGEVRVTEIEHAD